MRGSGEADEFERCESPPRPPGSRLRGIGMMTGQACVCGGHGGAVHTVTRTCMCTCVRGRDGSYQRMLAGMYEEGA